MLTDANCFSNSFTVTAFDGAQTSNVASLTVYTTYVNDKPPVLTLANNNVTHLEGHSTALNLGAVVSDADLPMNQSQCYTSASFFVEYYAPLTDIFFAPVRLSTCRSVSKSCTSVKKIDSARTSQTLQNVRCSNSHFLFAEQFQRKDKNVSSLSLF